MKTTLGTSIYSWSLALVDREAPFAPTSLVASNATETTIDLTWVSATDNVGVTDYVVYDNDIELVASTGNVTTYQLIGLTASTSYNLTIRALDAVGNESVNSNLQTISTTSPQPIYGTVISGDGGGTTPNGEADKAFDGIITTYYSPFGNSNTWCGQDYTTPVTINRVRILPRQDATNALRLNDCFVQWSTDNSTWISIGSPVSGVTAGNFTNFVEITFTAQTARYWRVRNNTTNTFGGNPAEIEFYEQ